MALFFYMHPLVNIAVKAVRNASKIILRATDHLDTLQITPKGEHDFVTNIDRLAEQEIITTIRSSYPDHGIIAEESGTDGKSDYVWIIDPIDGTNNFFHGHPYFCTSIGIKYKDRMEHGIIYDHLRQELFTATYGDGAYLNEHRIRVAKNKNLVGALLAVNLGHKVNDIVFNNYLKILASFLAEVSGARHAGAAALDLAYVACGRLNGFLGMNLAMWDVAAGVLMIQEAGGIVTDLMGEHTYLNTGNVVAGNPQIIKTILRLVRANITQA